MVPGRDVSRNIEPAMHNILTMTLLPTLERQYIQFITYILDHIMTLEKTGGHKITSSISFPVVITNLKMVSFIHLIDEY